MNSNSNASFLEIELTITLTPFLVHLEHNVARQNPQIQTSNQHASPETPKIIFSPHMQLALLKEKNVALELIFGSCYYSLTPINTTKFYPITQATTSIL